MSKPQSDRELKRIANLVEAGKATRLQKGNKPEHNRKSEGHYDVAEASRRQGMPHVRSWHLADLPP